MTNATAKVEGAISKGKGGGLARADIKALLENNADEIRLALPKHLTVERMTKVMLLCIDKTPDLLKCTQRSLIAALMQCAELGLEPGGVRGLAYLIPYKVKGEDLNRTCQFIVGYKGLVKLARQGEQGVADIDTEVVCEGDDFDYEKGTDQFLRHKKGPHHGPNGKPTKVWCVATLKSGVKHIEVMSWADVMAIKARSKSKDDGPWVTDPFQMARKTVIRRTGNYLDLSPEFHDALASGAIGDEADQALEVNAPPPIAKKAKAAAPPPDDAEYDDETGEVSEPALAETNGAPQTLEVTKSLQQQTIANLKEPAQSELNVAAPPAPSPASQPRREQPPDRPEPGTAEHAQWLGLAFDEAKTLDDLKWLNAQNPKRHDLHADLLEKRYLTNRDRLSGKK